MSEQTIQEGIQDIIQGMSEFDDDEVLINDFSMFDESVSGGRRVVIETSDDFVARRDTRDPVTKWQIKVWLVEVFDGWDTTLINFRNGRQAIIDTMDTDDNRSADGLEGITIDEIRSQTPVLPWFDPYLTPDELVEAEPIYLYQIMIMDAEEY